MSDEPDSPRNEVAEGDMNNEDVGDSVGADLQENFNESGDDGQGHADLNASGELDEGGSMNAGQENPNLSGEDFQGQENLNASGEFNDSLNASEAEQPLDDPDRSESPMHAEEQEYESEQQNGGPPPNFQQEIDQMDHMLGETEEMSDNDEQYVPLDDPDNGLQPNGEDERSHESDENSDNELDKINRDLMQAKEEFKHLEATYIEREREIVRIKEREKAQKKNRAEEKVGGSQPEEKLRIQYLKRLDEISALWDKLDKRREDADEQLDRLTGKLDKEDKKAQMLSQAFRRFKREIAREARFSMNGHPIQLKRILAFEAAEEAKDVEVGELRLKHIMLVNQTKNLEDQVKQKEELAEGLHLIDFEQLKIENQTLNEKIEERNDELHKLRKKTTSTVQVLTHIKEKLYFVEEQNQDLEAQLKELDNTVTNVRERVTKSKQAREALRAENVLLKQKQGFIGSDLLVSDFEGRKGTLVEVQQQLEGLQNRYASLAALVERSRLAEINFNRIVRHMQPRHRHVRDPRNKSR